MINLYLIRHGAAEAPAAGMPDALRVLTAKARKRMRKTARSFARKSGALDLVLVSPLVRALQTAEILAGEVKHGALAVLAELAPQHAAGAALKALSERAGKSKSIALVGHEPQLSRLLAALARLPLVQAAKLDIRPGAIVRVDVSGLPLAKRADARWWIKSGARHKGLPLKKESAPPAKAKSAAPPAKKKSARPAPKRKPVAKAVASRKAAPRPRKAAPKPRKAAVPAKPVPITPPKPAPVTPPKPAAPSAPQRFMGTPRPAAPPPRPAAPPPPAAPAAPPPAPPPPEKEPPTEGSP